MHLGLRAWFGTACAAPIALAGAAPALAQAWIGQIPGQMIINGQGQGQCEVGTRLPAAVVNEARDPALVSMQTYWQRVSASDTANVAALFQQNGRAEWTLGSQTLRRSRLSSLSDPLARRQGLRLAPEPVAFVRAAGDISARGLWLVHDGDGATAGHYLVDFRRESLQWKLARVEVLPAPAQPPEVTQYCSQPGDIEREVAERERREARRAARRAARDDPARGGAAASNGNR